MKWREAKAERAKRVGWRCERCGCKLTPQTAVGHHIIWKLDNGSDTPNNCLLSCASCEREFHKEVQGENLRGVGRIRNKRFANKANRRAKKVQVGLLERGKQGETPPADNPNCKLVWRSTHRGEVTINQEPCQVPTG